MRERPMRLSRSEGEQRIDVLHRLVNAFALASSVR
jgi:hypothetical protein